MNILIAPNAMKGSLDAFRFAGIVETAFRTVSSVFNLHKLPIADGGDGSGAVLAKAMQAVPVELSTCDPLGRGMVAEISIAGNTAIIELASASGVKLLKSNELNPMRATSYGTGLLIKQAMEMGCQKILLCVGGSATIDGGLGLLSALGFVFTDARGNKLSPEPTSMAKIVDIIPPESINSGVEIVVLSDVNNPLLGEDGAVKTFGKQKGADAESMILLEEGLADFADSLEKKIGRNLCDMEGMGAAGGVALGLTAFFNAKIVQGASSIFETIYLDKFLAWADWVITGEGKTDRQTLLMKAPYALAEKARALEKPVSVLCGSYEPEVSGFFDGIFPIIRHSLTLEQTMADVENLLQTTAEQFARLLFRSRVELFENHKLVETAHSLLSESKNEQALPIIERIDKNLAAHWYLKGLYFKMKQNWGEAINYFSQALEKDDGLAKAAVNIEMIKNIMHFTNPQMLNP
ncbi:MAG: glycerate kinase [Prolixibacteraceae bacterium]|nr:glycerate kinase [Prolixibacteraceae bacterium]